MIAPLHPDPPRKHLTDMPGYDCELQPAYLVALGCMDLEMEEALQLSDGAAVSAK